MNGEGVGELSGDRVIAQRILDCEGPRGDRDEAEGRIKQLLRLGRPVDPDRFRRSAQVEHEEHVTEHIH